MDSAHNPEAPEQVLGGQPVEGEALITVDQGPYKLLEIAVQQNLDVDKLERLMELDERWRAQRAKEAYFGALAKFQAAVPSLAKDSLVSFGTTKYKFASLPVIKDTIQSALSEAGLTYRWEFEDREGGELTATCLITHVDGHSEKTSMSAPADSSGSKNPVQQIGSTMTYLQRYTLIGALGLTTADKDDDGRQGVDSPMPPDDPDLKSHPQAAPRFDRDSKLGFGKHEDKTWREVEGGYLDWLIGKGGGDRAVFAEMEQDARKKPNLSELISRVHTGLNAISGSAASGILDEWLSTWGYKTVEDGTQETLEGLLGILRKEFRVENPKETQAEIPLGS